ncbi:MAG: outer membrane beta-barrel protein, partial [Bacteroidota bacterium]
AKSSQLSAIGMGNNVNRQGFSINDYMNFMGGLSNFAESGGGGRMRISFDLGESGLPIGANLNNGFTTTWAGGLNLNREFGKKTKLSASYFFNRLKNDIERTATAENLLGDETFLSEKNENRLSQNDNHRLNLTLRHELDSFQNLIFRTRLGFNDAGYDSEGGSETFNSSGELENAGFRDYHSDGENLNLNSTLTYRRRFKRPGRAFVADLTFGKNAIERQGSLFSQNHYFNLPQPAADTVRQRQNYDDNAMNYGATVSFTEPVGKREYLEIQASHQNYDNKTGKDFYDILSGGEEFFNDDLSNRYTRNYIYDRGGVNLMVNRKKWNLTTGAALQNSSIADHQAGERDKLEKNYTAVLPNLFFHF